MDLRQDPRYVRLSDAYEITRTWGLSSLGLMAIMVITRTLWPKDSWAVAFLLEVSWSMVLAGTCLWIESRRAVCLLRFFDQQTLILCAAVALGVMGGGLLLVGLLGIVSMTVVVWNAGMFW